MLATHSYREILLTVLPVRLARRGRYASVEAIHGPTILLVTVPHG